MAEQPTNPPSTDPSPAPVSNPNLSMECFDRFTKNFEASARRWELVVYPTLFAFIVLAAYGFFLIYHLTSDINSLARNVTRLTGSVENLVADMNSVTSNMNSIALTMNEMSKNMHSMSVNMNDMSNNIDTMPPMQASIQSLDQSVRAISVTTDQMRHSVRGMNRSIGQSTAPMQMMNSFVPFW